MREKKPHKNCLFTSLFILDTTPQDRSNEGLKATIWLPHEEKPWLILAWPRTSASRAGASLTLMCLRTRAMRSVHGTCNVVHAHKHASVDGVMKMYWSGSQRPPDLCVLEGNLLGVGGRAEG